MDPTAAATIAPAERVLVITRRFAAPRALVFRAWTDPGQMLRWMGPRDHPMCAGEGEVRPGATWRRALRPAGGGPDLWHGGTYLEVVEPERLVFTFAWDRDDRDRDGGERDGGERGPLTTVSVSFAEHDGVTTMTLRQSVFESQESRDGHRGGWTSTFDRLEEFLAEPRAAQERGRP